MVLFSQVGYQTLDAFSKNHKEFLYIEHMDRRDDRDDRDGQVHPLSTK